MALWQGGLASDACRQTPVALNVPFATPSAEAFDPINGVKQTLVVTKTGAGTSINGLLISDGPLIVRFPDR